MQRGLGGRDREAARLAVRAPPLAALAEDEVRGVAGARGRRVHRSAGQRASASARCSSATSRATTSSSPAKSAPASTRSCCWTCARGSIRSRSPKPPFTKAVGLPRLRAHWVRPEIVVQVAFIEWTVHGKLRHSAAARRAHRQVARARSCGRRRDHAPGKGAVPGRRDHQGRARRLLRGDRAGDAAAHPRPSRHDGAVSPRHRREGLLSEGRRRRAFPSGWSASRFRRRTARCTIRSSPTRDRCSGWPTRTASRRTCGHRARRICTSPTSASSTSIRPDDEPDVLRDAALAAPRPARASSGLPSWVKTSGSKGFHIVVPLDGKADFGEVARFAHAVGSAARERAIRSTSRRSSARPIAAGASWSTPDATATARRSPRLRRAREAGRAGVGAVHMGGDRTRRGRPADVYVADDGRPCRQGRRSLVGHVEPGLLAAKDTGMIAV